MSSSLSTQTQHYMYSQWPLKSPHSQIRLLQMLKPDSGSEDALRFSMGIYSLEEDIRFNAISYTWGSEADPKNIYINDEPCRVRLNCYRALEAAHWQWSEQRLRTDLVWVDSICIDQQNEAEKSVQVSIMGDIYARATDVLAYVGPAGDDSDFLITKAREVAEFPYPCQHADFLCADCVPPWERWVISLGIEDLTKLCDACLRFGRRHYWRRIWIIQETAKATSLSILCGTEMLNWEPLNNLESFLGLDMDEITTLSKALGNVETLESTHMHDVFIAKREHLQLDHLFSTYENSSCQDRRDYLYGLLSLIKWPDGVDPIFPNYSLSLFGLAVQVADRMSLYNIPDMLGRFGVTSNDKEVVESLQSRTSQSAVGMTADRMTFTPLYEVYEQPASGKCGLIGVDEDGNISVPLAKNGVMKGRVFGDFGSAASMISDISETSSMSMDIDEPEVSTRDSVNSEASDHSLHEALAFFSSIPVESRPQIIKLKSEVAGFVCHDASPGDLLIPLPHSASSTLLVLRETRDGYADIIGRALLLSQYGLRDGIQSDEGHAMNTVFTAQVELAITGKDAVLLFAQEDDSDDFHGYEPEQRWRRVLTKVTAVGSRAARIKNKSALVP